jgi:hypothetical protein
MIILTLNVQLRGGLMNKATVAPTVGEARGSDPLSIGNTQGNQSLLTAFCPELFIPQRAWQRLLEFLRGGGGTYGIAGPRGAGKSWLIAKAKHWADHNKGLGVWFPSPSEYEPMAFLAAISDVVAQRLQEHCDWVTGGPTKIARRRLLRTFAFGYAIVVLGLIAYFPTHNYAEQRQFNRTVTRYCTPAPSSTLPPERRRSCDQYTSESSSFDPFIYLPIVIATVALVAGTSLVWVAQQRFRSARSGLGRVRHEADELRRDIRFITTTKEGSEFGAEGGRSGLTARIKRSRELQLAERPATLSSLVQRFRTFAHHVSEVLEGPLIIGIDELDKMSDHDRVVALLRDVKGIFEISGVFFLVSISDEAARSLGLGALRTRNEFNSSFYTVLPLGPLEPCDCRELLEKRVKDFDPELASFIGVMSGGIAREVVRIAEIVYSKRAEQPFTVLDAAFGVMVEELQIFLENVVSASAPSNGKQQELENDKTILYRNLPERLSDELEVFSSFASTSLKYWQLEGTSESWEEYFEEEWRRLLVRFAVVAVIIKKPTILDDSTEGRRLQEIIRSASASAIVARNQLLNYLLPTVAKTSNRLNDRQLNLVTYMLGQHNGSSDLRQYASTHHVDPTTARSDLKMLYGMGLLTKQRKGLSSSWFLANYGGVR